MKKLFKKKLKIVRAKIRKSKRAVLVMKRRVKKAGKVLIRQMGIMGIKGAKGGMGITGGKVFIRQMGIIKARGLMAVKGSMRLTNKFAAVVLVFGLMFQMVGLSGNTLAYFNDQENSSENSFTATSLDFILEDGAWSSYPTLGGLLPGDSIDRLVTVKKLSGLDFEYGIKATKTAGSSAYCNALKIKALRENVQIYSGSLLGLNITPPEVIAPDGTDDWKFTLTLPSDASEFPGLACEFNLEFKGRQQNMVAGGFEDIEILGNVAEGISSGPEVDEFVQGISPIGDAYVDQRAGNTNYGSQHNLFVRSMEDNQGNPENRRVFVQFNLPIPPIATITSASLKMRLTNAPGEDRTLEAGRVLGSWTENGIKWNNQPSVSASASASANMGTLNDVWKSWDVTSDVQSFVAGTETNNGWRIKDAGEGSSNSQESAFASREHSSEIYGPILEIALTAQAATTTHLVINEVYYHVGSAGVGNDTHNEWVEIYNPTNSPVDISGWKICDNSTCDTIPSATPIPAKGFAVITNQSSTWGYWPGMPLGAIKIELNSAIGGGLANTGDRVILKNSTDVIIDQMSYGDDDTVLNPAVPHSGNGRSVARIIKGYDNDVATDWVINATPNPGTNPSENGEEVMRFTMQGMEIAKTVNELEQLVDNPTAQTEKLFSEVSEPDCACSKATSEIDVTPEPETVSGTGGGSVIVPEVEEATSEEQESLVEEIPEVQQAPAREATPTEENIAPDEIALEDPELQDPAPETAPEQINTSQEEPAPETVPVKEEIKPEAPPAVVEPEIVSIPAPTEEPVAGGSDE